MALWLAALALAAALGFAGAGGAQEITGAVYDGPTDRYPHGVLGDEIEYDTLTVTLLDGRRVSARWTQSLVFEDIAPRLSDLDGDGAPEVIAVESHEARGARLAIWGLDGQGALVQRGATPFIGQRFRWLAPVGAADLDGDGTVEIAYVDRPHLAKTLRIWRVAAEADGAGLTLTEVAALPGVTNHRIGWDFIAGGLRDCGDGPELITADGDWRRVMATAFDGTGYVSREIGPYSGPSDLDATLACE